MNTITTTQIADAAGVALPNVSIWRKRYPSYFIEVPAKGRAVNYDAALVKAFFEMRAARYESKAQYARTVSQRIETYQVGTSSQEA